MATRRLNYVQRLHICVHTSNLRRSTLVAISLLHHLIELWCQSSMSRCFHDKTLGVAICRSLVSAGKAPSRHRRMTNAVLCAELSILELSVCVAAKHMRADHENAINFELLYRAYSDHVSRGRLNLATKPFTRAAFSMVR